MVSVKAVTTKKGKTPSYDSYSVYDLTISGVINLDKPIKSIIFDFGDTNQNHS